MLKRILRNNLRRPLYSLAVVLFAAVLAVVLCYLYKSGAEEQRSFEQTYASVPVVFRVTNLDGTQTTIVDNWVADLFTEEGMSPNLAPFVGELYVATGRKGEIKCTTTDENGLPMETTKEASMIGISSFYVAQDLTENYGGVVHWYDGYGESILATEELVCLVPESMKEEETVEMTFFFKGTNVHGVPFERTVNRSFRVVGYYIVEGNSRLYCPYAVMKQVSAELGARRIINQVCSRLKDNNALPQLRETAAEWFAEPNPAGLHTSWGRFGYEYYIYAMDIDDVMLRNLEYSMKNSMRLNQLAAAVVFILSAGAGFLTGFLVIRSRKREISLMRMMGGGQVSIFTELALEQLCCIALGILVGGSYSMWQPVDRLALFGVIYFVGLSVALIVFLRKNLLSGSKEDE